MYTNRRRLRSARGQRVRRQRAEYAERSFAHLYGTGAMRRTHLRGHDNILKRLVIHGSGFNLGLVMRQRVGVGTPRGLHGHRRWTPRLIAHLSRLVTVLVAMLGPRSRDHGHSWIFHQPFIRLPLLSEKRPSATVS